MQILHLDMLQEEVAVIITNLTLPLHQLQILRGDNSIAAHKDGRTALLACNSIKHSMLYKLSTIKL